MFGSVCGAAVAVFHRGPAEVTMGRKVYSMGEYVEVNGTTIWTEGRGQGPTSC
ncbi:hypothetical protein J2Z21_002791 [Streptomyces griseochromogenes]|uniref:Uncharacterized protein n=1 Tax=Streptomyces griseochromogenes TaxID=68214 RepID=A0ABS4LR25_9ACTN|nr:hypothetical protein [Streptomyces griseochromogenes]